MRLKRASFCRKLSCRDRHIPFFFIFDLFLVKTCNKKKNWRKKIHSLLNVYYSEIRKNGMWSCAPSHSKWNKIIKFVLSVKLWEEIGSLQDPQKAYIFYAIHFLYISQKKSLNKLCLEPHDTYALFRTFFFHVNIKWFFFKPGQCP